MTRERFEMRKALMLIAICAGTVALYPASAGAATISASVAAADEAVSSDGLCSLREAVTAANQNNNTAPVNVSNCTAGSGADTINLAAGTYLLETLAATEDSNAGGDLDVNTSGGNLAIDGAGAASTTIDTDDAPAWAERVLHHPIGSGTLTVSDLTVTGGNAPTGQSGGGVLASANLALDRVRVTQNAAGGDGAGIRATGASLTINDSEISSNTAANSGGGVVAGATSNTIDDSVIRNNVVNSQGASAGGIGVMAAATLTLTDTLVSENDALDPGSVGVPIGGGITSSGTSVIKRSTISGNEVAGGVSTTGGTARSGAGLIAFNAPVTLVNSTVSGNTATGAGGHGAGLNALGASAAVTVAHSTFAGNVIAATETGSALKNQGGTINVRGSLLETSGGRPACGGIITSQDDNVFTDTTCGPEVGNDDNDADPQLTAVADEGGPQVGAPGFLTALVTQSPALTSTAIDHVPSGDCNDAPSGTLTNDERGFPRPFDSDGTPGAACEAGATEVFPCMGERANVVGTPAGETVDGTSGNDAIVALGGDDTLIGLSGNDRLCGGDGNDTLRGGADDDQLDGGANTAPIAGGDFASFSDSASAVTASVAGNSASGEGVDTFAPGTIENLAGSPQGDILTGDAGPNLIGGGAGDDHLNGLGGDDGLDGQVGTADEVLFADAPGAVTATLQDSPTQGSATGFGTDILFGLEEVSGSTFGDTLTGNGSGNVLRGLAGNDTLTGLAGGDFLALGADDDTANVQDGLADTIDCTGGGADTGSFDTSPAENFVACDDDGDGVQSFFDACPTQAGPLANGCPAPPVDPPAGDPTPSNPTTPATPKKCKKGQKLKKGKCVKKKRKRR